jgi:hypothetical protein
VPRPLPLPEIASPRGSISIWRGFLPATEKRDCRFVVGRQIVFQRTVEVRTMSNHASAGPNSKHLCERLFEELEKRLRPLTYEQGKDKCSIRGVGSVFVWIARHTKNYGSINVCFCGDANDAMRFSGLTIYKRANLTGVWKPYGGSFNIRSEKQLLEAVELLSTISYPKSLKIRQ